MISIVLSNLKESLLHEEMIQMIQHEKEQELFWKTNGFKTWEELVSYLKETNKTLYSYGDSLAWDPILNKIKYRHQCSDENDCNFWYETKYISEDDFINRHNNIDKKYPDVSRNIYGYIESWNK